MSIKWPRLGQSVGQSVVDGGILSGLSHPCDHSLVRLPAGPTSRPPGHSDTYVGGETKEVRRVRGIQGMMAILFGGLEPAVLNFSDTGAIHVYHYIL